MKRTLLNLLALGLSGAGLAATEERGLYFGSAAGKGDAHDADGFGLTADSSTSFRFFAGYDFSRYLAAEAGYLNLGSYRGRIVTVIPGAVAGTRLEVDGFSLGLRPQLDFGNDWFLQAQLGAIFWNTDTRIRTRHQGGFLGFQDQSDSGEGLYYGVGGGRFLGPSLRLSAEWTRFQTGAADFDFLNLALSCRVASF